MHDISEMMYNNEEYASGLSSDEINNLIMEEEATRQNAERLLLMDIQDEEEVLHFVANLEKVDVVTGTVEFDVDNTSTSMLESANRYSANRLDNICNFGSVEIHELCNFKCGRKEGHPRWMCKCLTIVNDTKPKPTMELALSKLKEWAKEINAVNMLKKKAVEAFDEHMEIERAVEAITFTEEELDEEVNYDGDNDDEIDYRNIDGMELESSSDDEVQQDDDSEGEKSDWENEDRSAFDTTVTVGDIMGDMMQLDEGNEEQLDGNDSSSSHGSLIPFEGVVNNVENNSEQQEIEEEENSGGETDDEEKFIMYQLVTDGHGGYEQEELNHDTLQRGWGNIEGRIPNRTDLPNVVDLPNWPNCCVAAQSHKKCDCGTFVKGPATLAKQHKELLNLYSTRQSENAKKRLEYTKHDAYWMIDTRLQRLNKLKNDKSNCGPSNESNNETAVKKKRVVKKKTTFKRRVEKRKRLYEICSDLVLYEKDFCHDVEGKRGKRFACPICQEPGERKTNAMQHAIAEHHCTVWRINPKTKIEEKFVLRNFKCMHENCKWQGSHSFPKFQKHMSSVHCRDFIPSNTCDDEYYVKGYEACIVRPLKHGCDRSDCSSYAPCGVCSESYGCSDMTCGCWLPRPTCTIDSCNTCKVREGKKRKLSRTQVV